MSSTTRIVKIPDTTWNLHKDDVLKLYLDDGRFLRDIVDIMKTEHGFEATISQYEARFRKWKVRRNLKVSEWRRIFSTLDSLHPGTISRIILSGRIVDEKTIRRARRNCKSKSTRIEDNSQMDDLFNNEAHNFSIEIQNQDGTWSQFLGGDGVDPILPSSHSSFDNLHVPQDLVPMDVTMDETYDVVENQMIRLHDCLTDNMPLRAPTGAPIMPTNIDDSGHGDFVGFLMNNPSPINWPSPGNSTAQPSFMWENSGINLEIFQLGYSLGDPYKWLKRLSLGTISKQLASWKRHFPTIQNEVIRPLRDMQAYMDVSGSTTQEFSHSSCYYQNLQALVPEGLLPKQRGNEMFVTSASETLNDESLLSGLVFTMMNRLIDLKDIPIGSILKLFAHSGKTNTMPTPFSEAKYDHATRALAEFLFEAAIEEGENSVLRILLRTGLVSANQTISTKRGSQRRAIERVAELRNLTAMEILLDTEEDLTQANQNNLIDIYTRYINFVDEECVQFCLLIRNRWPNATSEVFRDGKFWTKEAIRLSLTSFTPPEHSMMIEYGILHSIPSEMEGGEAVDAVRLIHDNCKKTGCGCFYRDPIGLKAALLICAEDGHYKLAKFLLPFCRHKYLLEALSVSIRSHWGNLVALLMRNIKDDYSQEYDSDESDDEFYDGSYDYLLAPLAEALLSNDTALVNRLERAGALSRTILGDVMAAAVEIRNIGYIKRLLDQFDPVRPKDLSAALFIAIENGFDDIAFILLDAGASVNHGSEIEMNGKKYNGLPLNAAIKRRNFQLARTILNADIGPEGIDGDTFRIIYKSDAISIFNEVIQSMADIFSRSPYALDTHGPLPSLLSDLHEAGQYDLLKILLSSLNRVNDGINRSFDYAIRTGNIGLAQFMLSHGAIKSLIPFLGSATVMGQTAILRQLLLQVQNNVTPGSIPFPLYSAIHDDQNNIRFNFECLDILFASNIFDFEVDYNCSGSPLCMAIDITDKHPDGRFFIVKKLLEAGCNPNTIGTTIAINGADVSETALLQAISKRNERLVRLLVRWKANVHGTAHLLTVRRTPLQKAAEVGDLAIVKFLLEHEVDVNAPPTTRSGGTALQFAAISGNCNVAAELLSHGALLHTPPLSKANGRWPIEGAAENGRFHMIEYLWIAKENTFLPDGCETGFEEKYCRRAMKLAERYGHIACRDLIAEKAGLSIDDEEDDEEDDEDDEEDDEKE
ncbi:hypothetical protein F4813DRAFT_384761 [Daldinia decipiens]|uniref:uncharacterized protein n=1 Tax=Daldinia decipiens TaxID=326647 RepID=UPI0020C38D53|nr:uncharacterized protein F4813DRAFT_384761 [Daldinia decipiens]KAI1662045.1 hypothetical protein F4813DRAFT_384761 [Daldinia decipiens]